MKSIEIKGTLIKKQYYDPRTEEGRCYDDYIVIEVDNDELMRAALANGVFNNTLESFIFDGIEYDNVEHFIPRGKTERILMFPKRRRFEVLKEEFWYSDDFC